ncbi:alpha/beta hydrolase family protein [Verrucomicrobium spinosum]|uniref:alpha/beta hydrolase family protein n=1 Tax=Verrucomicrobium spinosum TaxID=2736 RepID=UPI0001745DE5|nr:hypothetical protein [Verrucomicrobium spinosum]
MLRALSFIAASSLLAHASAAADSPVAHLARLDPFKPLEIRLPNGGCKPATTPAEWEPRRLEILKAAQSVMGPLPDVSKRCPLDVQIEEQTDAGNYIRQRITYQSEPGSRTPAYLCVPKTALQSGSPPRHPAVLCLHPTDNQVGYGVVVGLGGKANRQYASELAARGFVTIAPSYPHLAGYTPDLKGLGYDSGTMKAIWDNIRALDVLDSLPYVQHGRYGAVGHSLGGHNSVYTAVFDPRIHIVVSSCGLDSYRDYKNGDLRGWTQDRYMPRMAQYVGRPQDAPFDFPELLAAVAPRHVLISAPLRDGNFKWDSVDRVATAARDVYRLYSAADRLQVIHPDCDHDFPNEAREQAYRLFETLRKAKGGPAS